MLSQLGGQEKERRKLFSFSKTKVRRKERRKEGGWEGERKEGRGEGREQGRRGGSKGEEKKKQKDWTGPEFRKQPRSRCSHPPYTP